MAGLPSSLAEAAARLSRFQARGVPAESLMKQAAVAAILREGEPGLELLFIRRAEHPRDPWSGHMAFPGGRVDAGDDSALSAAVRETREELGLDLTQHGRRLAELSHVMAVAHGRPLPMIILPFVFSLVGSTELRLNHEVEEVLWVPLSYLANRQNRSTLDWEIAGAKVKLPCYPYQGRKIWGLTLKMTDELMSVLDPPPPLTAP